MSEEALQIAEERREGKNKQVRKRYTQLNTEFQRIAKRDKKAFFKKQRKTIEWERLEITSKIGDFKGIFHGRMGMIRDRNKDITEAEQIRKR